MESSEENLEKLKKIAKENEAKENAKKFIREKAKNTEKNLGLPIEKDIPSLQMEVEKIKNNYEVS